MIFLAGVFWLLWINYSNMKVVFKLAKIISKVVVTRVVAMIFLLLLPNILFAVSLVDFTPSPTDLSLNYLKAIFGTIEGVFYSSGSAVLGQIFQIYNAAALTIGGALLSYMLVTSTLNTAQTGEILGRQWSSVWIPIRVTLGVGLLLPRASGYCTIQTMLMWLIVQGIGAANSVWGMACDYVDNNNTLISGRVAGKSKGSEGIAEAQIINSIETSAKRILTMTTCVEALEKELTEQLEDEQAVGTSANKRVPPFSSSLKFDSSLLNVAGGITENDGRFDNDEIDGGKGVIYFPGKFSSSNSQYDAYKKSCGLVKINASSDKVTGSTNNLYKMTAFEQLYTNLANISQKYINNNYEEIVGIDNDLGLYIWEYYYAIKMLQTIAENEIPQATSDIYTKAKSGGWLTAGTFYFYFAKLGTIQSFNIDNLYQLDFDQDINPLTQNTFLQNFLPPYVAPPDDYLVQMDTFHIDTIKSNVLPDVNNELNEYVNKATPANQLRTSINIKKDEAFYTFALIMVTMVNIFIGFFNGIFGFVTSGGSGIAMYKILAGFVELVESSPIGFGEGSFSPIMSLVQVGWGFMDMALYIWLGNIVSVVMGTVMVSVGAGFFPGFFAAQNFVKLLLPMLQTFITVMLSSGAVFVLVMPLIPFIIFFFAALGWFFQVVQAMVAAPLVALGIVHPEGHEAFGKGEDAIMLSLNVFLRPSLMIVGFIVAAMMSYVALWLLNKIFLQATVYTIFAWTQ